LITGKVTEDEDEDEIESSESYQELGNSDEKEKVMITLL
jgi:hypothetical protein